MSMKNPMALNDLSGPADVKLLVDEFYNSVQQDDLIGPIFNEVIQDRWPVHLAKMYQFWESILFDKTTYQGRPFPPHAQLPIQKEHFDRWLALFYQNLDRLFAGPIAEQARFRADKMAELFQIKLANIRNDKFRPLL